MAIFKKADVIMPRLTHEEVVTGIIDYISTKMPHWHHIKFPKEQEVYDLLLIKTVKKMVIEYISPGNPNPLQKDKEQSFQIVVPITIDIEDIVDTKQVFDLTDSWRSNHLIVDSPQMAIEGLRKIDKHHER